MQSPAEMHCKQPNCTPFSDCESSLRPLIEMFGDEEQLLECLESLSARLKLVQQFAA